MAVQLFTPEKSPARNCAPVFLSSEREKNNEKQNLLHRDGDWGRGPPTARAVPADIFGFAFAEAEPLHGTAALCHTAKGNGRRRFDDWCEPSSCGLRLSRGLTV